MTPRARLVGAALLGLTFLGLEVLVAAYGGAKPSSFTGVEIGAVLGLASLVLEFQIVERAMASPKGDSAAATFQTFAMRLALVAPLTFAFQRAGSSVDATTFACSYLTTFFVYLCWLTWKTYHAPVHYRAKPRQFAPRVVERPRSIDAAEAVR